MFIGRGPKKFSVTPFSAPSIFRLLRGASLSLGLDFSFKKTIHKKGAFNQILQKLHLIFKKRHVSKLKGAFTDQKRDFLTKGALLLIENGSFSGKRGNFLKKRGTFPDEKVISQSLELLLPVLTSLI